MAKRSRKEAKRSSEEANCEVIDPKFIENIMFFQISFTNEKGKQINNAVICVYLHRNTNCYYYCWVTVELNRVLCNLRIDSEFEEIIESDEWKSTRVIEVIDIREKTNRFGSRNPTFSHDFNHNVQFASPFTLREFHDFTKNLGIPNHTYQVPQHDIERQQEEIRDNLTQVVNAMWSTAIPPSIIQCNRSHTKQYRNGKCKIYDQEMITYDQDHILTQRIIVLLLCYFCNKCHQAKSNTMIEHFLNDHEFVKWIICNITVKMNSSIHREVKTKFTDGINHDLITELLNNSSITYAQYENEHSNRIKNSGNTTAIQIWNQTMYQSYLHNLYYYITNYVTYWIHMTNRVSNTNSIEQLHDEMLKLRSFTDENYKNLMNYN